MTAEEKSIIEQLLANCSPTVQSIVNAENKFTIFPPFYDEESDEEGSSDEEDDELADEVSVIYAMETVQDESSKPKFTQQLSPAMRDVKEKNKLTASQQVYTTPFDTEEDDVREDTSNQQPHSYEISNVSIYHQYC